jgi:cell wall-associated NlpC family hydrolase
MHPNERRRATGKRALIALAVIGALAAVPAVISRVGAHASGPARAATAAPAGPVADLGMGQRDTSALDDSPAVVTAGVARAASSTTTPAATVGITSVTPTRVLDTRATGRAARNAVTDVVIAGRASVPAIGAKAVVLTLTAVRPAAAGFVAAVPCGAPFGTSSVNVEAGQVVANSVVVGLGAQGDVCLTSSVDTDLLVDVVGYAAAGGARYHTASLSRVLDTRTAGAPAAAGSIVSVPVTGAAGLPATGVVAAAVSVTVTGPVTPGFVTVLSCGSAVPAASSLNFLARETRADSTVAPVDASGHVCLYTSAAVHLVVDVTGWFGATGDELRASDPVRALDTRVGGAPRVGAGATTKVLAGVGAHGVVLNVTATGAAAAGYLTVWACDQARPATSAVGYQAGDTVADAVFAPVAADGTVCIYTSAPAHIVVDRTATFAPAGAPIPVTTTSAVTNWALTQTGDVYAAMNPYRFGASKYGKAWDCPAGQTSCSKVDTQGIARSAPSGSFVYDCSGLVVAAWLQAGVDLVKANASWTVPMMDHLPRVTRAEARPGDLVMFQFDPSLGQSADHVGLYLSDTEMVHAGTCPGSSTSMVCRTSINWSKVVAVLRPTG